jgi:hypothetical protein
VPGAPAPAPLAEPPPALPPFAARVEDRPPRPEGEELPVFEPPPAEVELEPLLEPLPDEPLLAVAPELPLPELPEPEPPPDGGVTTFCTVFVTSLTVLPTLPTVLPTVWTSWLTGAGGGGVGVLVGGGVGTLTVGSADVTSPTGPPSEKAKAGTVSTPTTAQAVASAIRRIPICNLSATCHPG